METTLGFMFARYCSLKQPWLPVDLSWPQSFAILYTALGYKRNILQGEQLLFNSAVCGAEGELVKWNVIVLIEICPKP